MHIFIASKKIDLQSKNIQLLQNQKTPKRLVPEYSGTEHHKRDNQKQGQTQN